MFCACVCMQFNVHQSVSAVDKGRFRVGKTMLVGSNKVKKKLMSCDPSWSSLTLFCARLWVYIDDVLQYLVAWHSMCIHVIVFKRCVVTNCYHVSTLHLVTSNELPKLQWVKTNCNICFYFNFFDKCISINLEY